MAAHLPRPTKTFHSSTYPSISPTRPELSLRAQTVLVTGGASGIGLEISKAFAVAGASTIAILARSEGPMAEAKRSIESSFPDTKVSTVSAALTDAARVDEAVKSIGNIDVLVLNAGTTHAHTRLLDLSEDVLKDLWDVNVIGQLNVIRAFMALPPRSSGAKKTMIYASTGGVHGNLSGTSGYGASKLAMTYLMRSLVVEYAEAGVRIFTIHPGIVYTSMASKMGFPKDAPVYDSPELPGHFAVWLCSSEADFLTDRFISSNWDIDELIAKKALIERDPSQLQTGLVMDKVLASSGDAHH